MRTRKSLLSNSTHGWVLACFALVVTAALAITQHNTRDRIDSNEKARIENTLAEVVPALVFDHPLQQNPIEIIDKQTNQTRTCYIASVGNIEMLVGILANGTISGVRITKHSETPGLGDAIELQRSDWIKSFDGKSQAAPGKSLWTVRKQGGEFDQFTGATITPRAVITEVYNTLRFFDSVKQQLFNDE